MIRYCEPWLSGAPPMLSLAASRQEDFRVSERKRPIEIEVRASLVIDPRDEPAIAGWDMERLRHCCFEIFESSAELVLPGCIRATVHFITPTPFDHKEAEQRRG